MAISKNILLQGMSGTLGNLVFRNRGRKTIVCLRPAPRKSKPTAAQKVVKEKFTTAVRFAKKACKDPALKVLYAAAATGAQSPYNAAVKNAFSIPQVHRILLTDPAGKPGSVLYIKATDYCKVGQVTVTVISPEGSLMEQGNARQSKDPLEWVYKIEQTKDLPPGSLIRAKAINLPGNEGIREIRT